MDYKLRIDRIGLLRYIIHKDPVFKKKGDSDGTISSSAKGKTGTNH